jgi:hypothetical protein
MQCGSQELVEASEREVGFSLDAARAENVHVLGCFASVSEECRLSDTSTPAHDEGSTPRCPGRLEQFSNDRPLSVTSDEHARSVNHRSAPTRADTCPVACGNAVQFADANTAFASLRSREERGSDRGGQSWNSSTRRALDPQGPRKS